MNTTTKRKGRQKHTPSTQKLRCQYCGAAAHLRSAEGIYKHGGSDVLLYVCSNYPKCDSYVRVHSGTTTPVGSLANTELRALRTTAHQHFGELYKSGLMTKSEAYDWLSFTLNLPLSLTHIGYFSEYYCNQVIKAADKYLSTWKHKIKKPFYAATADGGVQYAAQ